ASQRLNSQKALESEYIAIAAAGGIPSIGRGVGAIGGVTLPAGYTLPFGRIDLVGIQLEIFGPNPTAQNHSTGIDTVLKRGRGVALGSPPSGANDQVKPDGTMFQAGTPVPEGWLVLPHDSPLSGPDQLKQADVEAIVDRSLAEANKTRAAIRDSGGAKTKMVI